MYIYVVFIVIDLLVDVVNRRVKFDYLDKAFCILKLQPNQQAQKEVKSQESLKIEKEQQELHFHTRKGHECLIRRVDLIVSPPEQYPFALVSWTGSKVTQCVCVC